MFFKSYIALLAASALIVTPSVAGPVRRFGLDDIIDNIKNLPESFDNIKDAGESLFSAVTENAADGVDVIASAIKHPEDIPDVVESAFDKATSNVAESFASATSNIGETFASVTSEIGSDPTTTSTSENRVSASDSDPDDSNDSGKTSVPSTMMFTTVAGSIILGSLYIL